MRTTTIFIILSIFVSCKQSKSDNIVVRHYSLSAMSLEDLRYRNVLFGNLKENGFDSIVEWYSEQGIKGIVDLPTYTKTFDERGNLIYRANFYDHGTRRDFYDSLNFLIESKSTNLPDDVTFRYRFVEDSLILYRYAYRDTINLGGIEFFQFNKNGRLIKEKTDFFITNLKYNEKGQLESFYDSSIHSSSNLPLKSITKLYYTANHLDSSVESAIYNSGKNIRNTIILFDENGLVKNIIIDEKKSINYRYYKRKDK